MKMKRIRNPKFSKVYENFDRKRILFYYHNKDFKIVVYNLGIDISINLWDKCMEGQLYGYVTINKNELLESISDIYNNKWIKRNKCMKRSYKRFILNNINKLNEIYVNN
jgi:hypothetical protein